MPERPVLEAVGLTRKFMLSRPKRALLAVDDASLRLYGGEILALVGESGSGKSTMIRMLLGLLAPTSGDVRLGDEVLSGLPRQEIARRLQPVFQNPYASLNPKKTIADSIAMPLRAAGITEPRERATRVRDVMERTGLASGLMTRYPGELSGGQRQRVAIARALVANPQILVCDEPTSALDVSIQAQILNLLAELRRSLDFSMLLVTHNLAVVEHLADRVAVMYRGRIVEEASADRIFDAPAHPYTQLLVSTTLPIDPDRRPAVSDVAPAAAETPLTMSGCGFRDRCARAGDRCRDLSPALDWSQGSAVACHYPLRPPPLPRGLSPVLASGEGQSV